MEEEMRILAIDPGPTEHGWVLLDTVTWRLLGVGSVRHEECDLAWARSLVADDPDVEGRCAMESPEPLGMPLSHDLLATIRKEQQLADRFPGALRITRKEVKREVCGKTNVNATTCDMALRARYCERHACEEKLLKGTKNAPGPLYGISSHAWAALGVAEVVASRLG